MRLCSLTLLACAALAAEDGDIPLIIVADRIDNDPWRATASTGVVDADERERLGNGDDWTRPMALLPGVDRFVSGGGLDGGGLPAFRLRGTNRNADTRVLVDGIPLADPGTVDGDPMLLGIDLPGIERVEIARGPQSGLYGSSAVGGVVDIRTLRPTAEHHGALRGELGSFAHQAGALSATGPIISGAERPRLGYALSASGMASDGVSATVTERDGDPRDFEADRLRRTGLGGRLVAAPVTNATAYVAAWTGTGHHDYDTTDPDDGEGWRRTESWRVALGGEIELTEATSLALDVAHTANRRDEHDLYSGTQRFDSATDFASLRGITALSDWARVQAGVDVDRQQADYAALDQEEQRDIGVWVRPVLSGSAWETALALRYDALPGDDALTGRLGAVWMPIEDAVRVHGSLGNAYRAPSLDDRLSSYFFPGFPPFFPDYSYSGNPDLESQRSFGWDLGLGTRNDLGFDADLTAFGTHYRNRAVLSEDTSNPLITVATLENESSPSRTVGVEAEAGWRPDDRPWWLSASGTWQDSADQDGERFIGLPEWKGALASGWDGGGLRLTAVWWLVGSRRARTDEELPGYGTLDLAAALSPVPWCSLYARAENILDRGTVEGVTFTPGDYYAGAPRRLVIGAEARY